MDTQKDTWHDTDYGNGHLLERMGGPGKLKELVYGIYDGMFENPFARESFVKFILPTELNQGMTRLKDATIVWCIFAFGEDPDKAANLFVLHAQLHISVKLYDICMTATRKVVKKMKYNAAMQKELVYEFEAMREPIVDPSGVRLAAVKDRMDQIKKDMEAKAVAMGKQAVDNMGFPINPERIAREEAKAKEVAERKARMDAVKADRVKAKAKAKASERASSQPSKKADVKRKPSSETTGKQAARPKSKPRAAPPQKKESEESPQKTDGDPQLPEEFSPASTPAALQAPAADAPGAEATAAEVALTETPADEGPAVESPAAEAPTADVPAANSRKVFEPEGMVNVEPEDYELTPPDKEQRLCILAMC